MTHQYVFVYGSLKRKYWNNRVLGSAKFIDEAVTIEDTFAMIDGSFPYVLRDGIFRVKGELFLVEDEDTLLRLDRLEGYPNHYDKMTVSCKCMSDQTIAYDALMYVAATGVVSRVQNRLSIIPSNHENWVEWRPDVNAD